MSIRVSFETLQYKLTQRSKPRKKTTKQQSNEKNKPQHRPVHLVSFRQHHNGENHTNSRNKPINSHNAIHKHPFNTITQTIKQMTYEQAQEEINMIRQLPLYEVQRMYDVNSYEEIITLIREEIDEPGETGIHSVNIENENGFRDLSNYYKYRY